jgi:hypothetical protein
LDSRLFWRVTEPLGAGVLEMDRLLNEDGRAVLMGLADGRDVKVRRICLRKLEDPVQALKKWSDVCGGGATKPAHGSGRD